MKQLIFVICFISALITAKAQAPKLEWVKNMGGTSNDAGRSVTADASGNVYTAGWFMGTSDFDPGKAKFNLTSAGDSDAFITKLDASGNFLWAKRIGGAMPDAARSVHIDPSGNVYITGNFNGTVDFDPGTAIFNRTAVGTNDMFILKLNAAGNFIWAISMGSAGRNIRRALTFDNAGNLIVTGAFSGTVDFNPSPSSTYNLSAAGGWDICLEKYDPSGNFIWAKSMGGTDDDIAVSVSMDGNGNIYTGGQFKGTADFDPSVSGTYNLTSAGDYDMFVSKLDSTGNFIWARKIGGTDIDNILNIQADASGNLYYTGYFFGTCDFDPGAASLNYTSAGYNDICVSALDASGNLLWVKCMGSSLPDGGASIAIGNSGNIYICGWFHLTVDFDPGPSVYNLTAIDYDLDFFVLKLTGSGSFIWARKMGGTGTDIAWSLALDESGSIYVTGEFGSKVDFSVGTGKITLTSAGLSDIFVLKLSQTGGSSPGETGFDLSANEIHVSAYPNPNNGEFTVRSDSEGDFIIKNCLGQTITSFTTTAEKNYTIQITGLPSGVYFISGLKKNSLINEKIVVTNRN